MLPAIVLAHRLFAYILRLTRTSVAENLTADHVRTARAKGLSERSVIRDHVLRNSLIPVVTYLGADLGTLMAGAIVTEGIFNVPGVGNAGLPGHQPRRGLHGRLDRDRHGHRLRRDEPDRRPALRLLDPRIRYV